MDKIVIFMAGLTVGLILMGVFEGLGKVDKKLEEHMVKRTEGKTNHTLNT